MNLNFDTENLDEIINYIQIGCVPEVSIDENHLAERNKALLAHLEIAKPVLNKLSNLLSKLINQDADLQIKLLDILNSCLYLCGEHRNSDLPWSDCESHSLMNLCLEKICTLMHYHSIEELFAHLDVSSIFVGLQNKLKNDNWKSFPAAVECYMWMLNYFKMPRLNSFLYLIMPLPLNMFDDYRYTIRVTALDALHHIIDNTPAVELEMSGYDIVMLKSLECGLSSSAYQLIPHILKCILLLISKIQMKHLSKKNSLEWTKFDDVMNILLPRMELEYNNKPVELYAFILPLVLEFIGLSSIRWAERLIPLFAKYIMHHNSTWSTVKAIEIFIKQTWPRKDMDWNLLLTILVKALYDEDKTNEQPNTKNILAIVECIRTLEAAKPEYVRNVLNKLKECKEFQSKQCFKESLETL